MAKRSTNRIWNEVMRLNPANNLSINVNELYLH